MLVTLKRAFNIYYSCTSASLFFLEHTKYVFSFWLFALSYLLKFSYLSLCDDYLLYFKNLLKITFLNSPTLSYLKLQPGPSLYALLKLLFFSLAFITF